MLLEELFFVSKLYELRTNCLQKILLQNLQCITASSFRKSWMTSNLNLSFKVFRCIIIALCVAYFTKY